MSGLRADAVRAVAPGCLALALLGACSAGDSRTDSSPAALATMPACAGSETVTREPPDALAEELGNEAQGVVGGGDLFFLTPAEGTWGDTAERRGDEFYLKIGVWVGADSAPDLDVQEVDGPGVGRVEQSPTADGLPGFLPTGVRVPAAGCWQVTARLGEDVVEIHVLVE